MNHEEFQTWAQVETPQLLRLARVLFVDSHTAEDAVQIVLERMFLRWTRIENRSAYARRALYNAKTSHWRRAYVRNELPVPVSPEVAQNFDDGSDARRAAIGYLQSLPRQQRAVLALRFVDDMSDDAIADMLDISILTVRSHSTKALATLRKSLDAHKLVELSTSTEEKSS